MNKLKKWEAIQELKSLGLKSPPAQIFSYSTCDLIIIDNFMKGLNYNCGLRTDLPNQTEKGFHFPFYLPIRSESLEQKKFYLKCGISTIWIENEKFKIIVRFSPNLIEDCDWSAYCWVTNYRELNGEVAYGYFPSIRHAWNFGKLKTIDQSDMKGDLLKVRGDLIRKKLFNRVVEVSHFPTLGYYYWEIQDENLSLSTYPQKNWK
jgi:hypothetical protein